MLVEKKSHQLGSTTIWTWLHEADGSEMTFLNIHDDEDTAVEAGLVVLSELGGRLIQIRHSGERMVKFESNSAHYAFDPNRIFTDLGARKTLGQEGKMDEESLQITRDFARELLRYYHLDRQSLIITLHNNGEGGDYSTTGYLPGGPYEKEVADIHVEPGQDPDNLFFVTDRKLFEEFKDAGFNVVLQDNLNATDDGSLSVLAAVLGIPYINVEAQHGSKQQQIEMIRTVYKVVAD